MFKHMYNGPSIKSNTALNTTLVQQSLGLLACSGISYAEYYMPHMYIQDDERNMIPKMFRLTGSL